MKIFIDGKFYNQEDAKISILDHGFLYGYGAFTTISTYKKNIIFLEDHIDRLIESAEIIGIDVVWEKKDIIKWVQETYELNKNEFDEVRIRLNISKGVGPDINIEGSDYCKPSLSIIVSELLNHFDKSYKNGISVLTVNLERVFPKSKNFNFLPSIVALKEARKKGFYDSLFIDHDGYVTEATTGNIFFFKDNKLYTTSSKILEGITRLHIIRVAQNMGIKVIKKMFTLGELLNADEIFISGTTKKILPVSNVNNKTINNINSGFLTKKLNDHYIEYIESLIKMNNN